MRRMRKTGFIRFLAAVTVILCVFSSTIYAREGDCDVRIIKSPPEGMEGFSADYVKGARYLVFRISDETSDKAERDALVGELLRLPIDQLKARYPSYAVTPATDENGVTDIALDSSGLYYVIETGYPKDTKPVKGTKYISAPALINVVSGETKVYVKPTVHEPKPDAPDTPDKPWTPGRPTPGPAPRTGDLGGMAVWGMTFVVSALALAAVSIGKKRLDARRRTMR